MALIPSEVRRFVLTSVATVPHLEALLLLRRFPEARWTGAELARRLYIGADAADALLDDLHARGLAASESVTGEPRRRYRYPADTELDALVALLEETYATQLIELSRLIHSKTDRKAQQFADAFAFNQEEPR